MIGLRASREGYSSAWPRSRAAARHALAQAAPPRSRCLPALALAGCQTGPTGELADIDAAQGSEQNIASLTSVIDAQPARSGSLQRARLGLWPGRQVPRGAEGFRHRHQAEAELLPGLCQPRADLPLPWRPAPAPCRLQPAIQINRNYDAAYIGRGNLYRKAGRMQRSLQRFPEGDPARHHRSARLPQSRPDLSDRRASMPSPSRISRPPSRSRRTPPSHTTAAACPISRRTTRTTPSPTSTWPSSSTTSIAESWANQALVYERRGDKKRAPRSYSHAAQLDPNYKPARDGLARTRG